MNKYLPAPLFCLLTIFSFTAYCQPYAGLRTGSYAGLQGVIFNPASMVDNRLQFDFNLVSVDFSVANNYIELSSKALFKPSLISSATDFKDQYLKEELNGKTKAGYLGIDIMGPGFYMQLTKKDAIGFYIRVRGMLNIKGMDEATAQSIYNGVTSSQYYPYTFSGSNFNLNANYWAEYAVPYARVVYNDGYNVIKAGITPKLLQGISSTTLNVSNYKYAYGGIDSMKFTSGNVNYGHSVNQFWSNQSTGYFEFEKFGIGVDLGIVYEYRPDYVDFTYQENGSTTMRRDIDAYKVKLGFSITDLGTIVYNKAIQSRNAEPNTSPFPQSDFSNLQNIQDLDNRFNALPGNQAAADNGKYSMALPLALNFSGDYNFNNGLYLNFNPIIALETGTSDLSKTYYNSTFYLTGRYERRWWGVYVPVGYNTLTGFNAGLSLRGGPFFIGSENIISNLASSWVNSVNIFFGFRVPILYKKFAGGGLDCPPPPAAK